MISLSDLREGPHPGIANTANLPVPSCYKPLFDHLWAQEDFNVMHGIANDMVGAEHAKPMIIWRAFERIQESVDIVVREQSKPYSGFTNPLVEEEHCVVCGSNALVVDRLKGDVICSRNGCGEVQADLSESVYHGNMYRDPEKIHWAPLHGDTVIENFDPQSSIQGNVVTGASAATKEAQCAAVRAKMFTTAERYAIPDKVVHDAAMFFDCHRYKLCILRSLDFNAAACLMYAFLQDRYERGTFPSWRCIFCPPDKRPRFDRERDMKQHLLTYHNATR